MSSKSTENSSASLARLIGVAAIAGASTWLAASLLTTAWAQPEPLGTTSTVAPAAADDTSSPSSESVEAKMRERRTKELASGWAEVATTRPTDVERLEPTESEWRAAADAMRPHTPNALRRIERAPNVPARARMMRALVDRYRELQRIERRDPQQYKRELEQTELEDQILGVARQIARESDPASAKEMRTQLRDLVSKLVDARIASREARLEKLSATLAAERQRLAKDRQDREKSIERQVAEVVKTRRSPRGSEPPTAPRGSGGTQLAAPSPSTSSSR
jgi:hypothetical protein